MSPDLDSELRRGLAAGAPPLSDASELLPVYRRRVARRRQRRAAGVVAALAAVVVGAVALTSQAEPDTSEPVATSTTTTSTSTTVPMLSLPAEGVAVESAGGVTLLALDGRVLGHLAGYTLDVQVPGGPQMVLGHGKRYALEEGGLRELRPDVQMVLAYGAELVKVGDADPGRFVVRRDGRDLFELGNNMGETWAVSYDRDVVTYRSEAYDLRTARTSPQPASCWVADRHGSRQYVLCHEESGVRVGDEVIVESYAHIGVWRTVMASPDGGRLLLEWSGDCDVPTALLARSTGSPPTAPFGEAASAAHGWTADGRAVISVPATPACGVAGDPGVWLVSADGRTKTRIRPDPGTRVAMWSPALSQ